MAPSRLGPLALEARLGTDSDSTVWRAVHVRERKSLAVKVYSVPFGGTDAARREFAREWETLKRVRSPGIARCYGGGFEGGSAYLAYELVDGETLAESIARRERLPWETVLEVAEQLIEGLEAAHDRHVIHAGLEPDKIMLTPAGLAKVLDLRSQRHTSLYRSQRPPSAHQLAFQPPEVIEDPSRATAKSDLYSFGAVLFYALTGRPPVSGGRPDAVIASVAAESPPKVASLVLDCPIWLSSLIDQLLAKDPAARPHSAAAVRLALAEVRRRASAGTGVAEHATAGFSPLQVAVDRREARELLGRAAEDEESVDDGVSFYERWWFLSGLLVMLVGLVVWLLLPPSPDQLRREAESLLASDEWSKWKTAQGDYLEPLLRHHPESEHAPWAREQIDRIEMRAAEAALDFKARTGRPLRGEGERLYALARRYEQFGDAATALDKYQAMVNLLGDTEEDRPYVNLARRQIQRIRSQGDVQSERRRLVEAKLAEADQRLEEGKPVEARTLLQSIVELYAGSAELEPLVSRAQSRLAEITSGD